MAETREIGGLSHIAEILGCRLQENLPKNVDEICTSTCGACPIFNKLWGAEPAYRSKIEIQTRKVINRLLQIIRAKGR